MHALAGDTFRLVIRLRPAGMMLKLKVTEGGRVPGGE